MSKRVAFPLFFSLALFVITPATSHGIEEIKIASTGPGVSTLPLEMATRKGFFRDEGLDVLTITMRTNIAVNALLTPVSTTLRRALRRSRPPLPDYRSN
jgi:ABC-type nitrate/sulfonate/bicarbonate transport system substrate-binding protein